MTSLQDIRNAQRVSRSISKREKEANAAKIQARAAETRLALKRIEAALSEMEANAAAGEVGYPELGTYANLSAHLVELAEPLDYIQPSTHRTEERA